MMKPFRKSKRLSNSLSSSKHSISRISSGPGAVPPTLMSPKKVIKALYSYRPQGPGELQFSKGDFFHVMDDAGVEANGWYEATNPATNVRGMVPVSYFEVFTRPTHADAAAESPRQAQTLYAVTLYEFKAERPDELDIVAGENLVICAHHDYEWFIAKPITRLGGPGLVPALYVRIIDISHPAQPAQPEDADLRSTIDRLQIPTVEQWKDQTARYQALTIPLGYVSQAGAPAASANTQYFSEAAPALNRLLGGAVYVVEAAVELYVLEQGRYQYLVVARLLNGRTRQLYRFYQDFYDLQVKLLELFPYEAGKMENLRRIIPSIPGPLIHVNDSISKLRREKLDYYLRNLVALPAHILRSAEVQTLFDVAANGFDKEMSQRDSGRARPVHQQSTLRQDRLSQYLGHQSAVHRASTTPSLESPLQRTTLASLAQMLAQPAHKVKVKFYYEDDIFVLLLPATLRLADLKTKLVRRLALGLGDDAAVYLFMKDDYDEFMDCNNIALELLTPEERERLFALEIADDDRFHSLLYDKCKVVVLSG